MQQALYGLFQQLKISELDMFAGASHGFHKIHKILNSPSLSFNITEIWTVIYYMSIS